MAYLFLLCPQSDHASVQEARVIVIIALMADLGRITAINLNCLQRYADILYRVCLGLEAYPI